MKSIRQDTPHLAQTLIAGVDLGPYARFVIGKRVAECGIEHLAAARSFSPRRTSPVIAASRRVRCVREQC